MKSLPIRRKKFWLALLVAVVAGLFFLVYRHHRMIKLYHTVLWGGTSEAHTSVVQLASFHGEEATELLLCIASPRRTFLDRRQDLAVQLLAKRKDPQVAARLAEALNPQSALALRTAVAKALLDMECNRACTESVLHYLERMSWGELNVEEAFERDPDLRFQLKPEQDEVVNKLQRVLWKDQGLTIDVLTDKYGLGSDYPSSFGLHIVEALNLRSACPALEKSSHATFDTTLSGRLQILERKLECPAASPRSRP